MVFFFLINELRSEYFKITEIKIWVTQVITILNMIFLLRLIHINV